MMKSLSILLAAAAMTSPALAESFVHEGKTYVYSVEQRGAVKILAGEETTTHQPFTLRVSKAWVDGTVDGKPVSFALRDVVRLKPEVTVSEVSTR